MRVSSAPVAVAANITPTVKQIILLIFIFDSFPASSECQFRRINCRSSSSPQRPFCTSFFRNLMRDVERRDYDHERADLLAKVGEVDDIHGYQIEPGVRLRTFAPT